ncbi:MAG: hypothetical protein M3288_01085 [Thermoproteota archaeon]|nr:hypothetical protein [Thermoproteota archaeon]
MSIKLITIISKHMCKLKSIASHMSIRKSVTTYRLIPHRIESMIKNNHFKEEAVITVDTVRHHQQ